MKISWTSVNMQNSFMNSKGVYKGEIFMFSIKVSVGFESLITLTEMWDDKNPCLIMLKSLKR